MLCEMILRIAASNICFVSRKNIDEERALCVTYVAGSNVPIAKSRSAKQRTLHRRRTPRERIEIGQVHGSSDVGKGEKMQKMISDPRIAGKFAGDRTWSLIAIAVLWLLYAFVFYEVKDYAGSSEVVWSLLISGGLVILFNTASIFAMIFHLSEEREEIYGLDLHYLDLKKRK
jgi:hypothetical protein